MRTAVIVAATLLPYAVHAQKSAATAYPEKDKKRIGNSFASVPRNARGCGVFRVGERCFSL
jgi:hypothetical protein